MAPGISSAPGRALDQHVVEMVVKPRFDDQEFCHFLLLSVSYPLLFKGGVGVVSFVEEQVFAFQFISGGTIVVR